MYEEGSSCSRFSKVDCDESLRRCASTIKINAREGVIEVAFEYVSRGMAAEKV